MFVFFYEFTFAADNIADFTLDQFFIAFTNDNDIDFKDDDESKEKGKLNVMNLILNNTF